MKKAAAIVLLLISGMTHAQGIIKTAKPFSSTPFCKNYRCVLVQNDNKIKNTTKTYRTKYGDFITLISYGNSVSSPLQNVLFAIDSANLKYFPTDEKTFEDLQVALFGSIETHLTQNCYTTQRSMIFSDFSFTGSSYSLVCFNGNIEGAEAMFFSIKER